MVGRDRGKVRKASGGEASLAKRRKKWETAFQGDTAMWALKQPWYEGLPEELKEYFKGTIYVHLAAAQAGRCHAVAVRAAQ